MLQQIQAVLDTIAGALWGWPMLIFLISTGLWLTIVLRGVQFRMLGSSLWDVVGPQKPSSGDGIISNRSAMITALAATAGTGNIAGVATAIALGGPGAMFWMWVSGLLGMALKYSETLLGVYYRVQEKDGTFILEAYMVFKDSMFKTRIHVKKYGLVSMSDEELKIEGMPVLQDTAA
jgi:AGCS family alanine or glycine:cation symporter